MSQLTPKRLEYVLFITIATIIIVQTYGLFYEIAIASGDTLLANSVPLGSFFADGGVIYVLVLAAVLMIIILLYLPTR